MTQVRFKYSWHDIERSCVDISRQILLSKWEPDFIVGLTRGGTIPATMLSHFLNIPMQSLDVSLRDHPRQISNCSLSSDLFDNDVKILVVDDINDTGATFNWIKNDWMEICLPGSDKWPAIWRDQVKFASLVTNEASDFQVDFASEYINKHEHDVWIDFPWEVYWKS